jgi:hypothetical protein
MLHRNLINPVECAPTDSEDIEYFKFRLNSSALQLGVASARSRLKNGRVIQRSVDLITPQYIIIMYPFGSANIYVLYAVVALFRVIFQTKNGELD